MENIREKVKSILRNDFGVKDDIVIDDNTSLLVGSIALDAKMLVYLVLCAERDFNIKFSDKDFDDNRFYSFGGFCDAISNYCGNKAMSY